ncbi:MAG TPA: DUF882 domain-containing protein [Xanthobacteraceae bacterium]|nr:DUF882 domain-containing protein [Xanthobacteraceae bacterium]
MRAGYSCGFALLVFLLGSRALQNAVAEGETRTITMHHLHTGEDITVTYKREGRYDRAALEKLDWFLRDWRRGESTGMDPRLIDLVWEVQREAGINETVQIVCGYRSPQTNAMLRRRSEGVAEFSQHMLGRAMDFYIPGIPLEKLREIGLRLERGGVGFYPQSGSPFVHMDIAGVRMWPRMTRQQLVRVFPDGRTVQIPTDGQPLSGYALALADIRKQGGMPSEKSLQAARDAGIDVDTVLASNERPAANPLAKLLGLAKTEDDEAAAATPAAAPSGLKPKPVVLAGLEPSREVKPKPAAASGKVASAMAKLPLVHVAKLLPGPAAAPSPTRAAAAVQPEAATRPPTANQIIVARGYWQGPPDELRAANPLAAVADRRGAAANADPDSTGSIGPFADDRASGERALAFADASDAATAAPIGIAALRAAALATREAVPAATTVATSGAADQAASALVTASASAMTVIKSGAHFANPWLRAVVLSPSVQRFLTTVTLGGRDLRALAALMIKPNNAVMMTFSAEPNPGLAQDHFSGAAIVFVSTINYPTYPTHTAALQ